VTPNATEFEPLLPTPPSLAAPAPPAPTVTAYVPAGMLAFEMYAAPPAPPPAPFTNEPPPPPAIMRTSAPAIALGIVSVPLDRMHVYRDPFIARVPIGPELDVIVVITSGVAASTKNPWPDAPKNASVVDCVDPVTGALTFTYRALSPVTVGVTVNVTTPLVLL
jgi:hypothetical protein